MPVYRRRKEQKTNYAKRLALLKSGQNRIVLRLSNLYVNLQYVEHNTKGDNVKLGLLSKELKEFGWDKSYKSLPACYLTGYLFGKLTLQKKLKKEVILDLGLQNSFRKGKIYSALKGIVDAGINVALGEDVFPEESRINGSHIKLESLFKKVKEAIDTKTK